MKNRGGFTIIETLITLAISSALFVTVMILFDGRQAKVNFAQGMKDLDSQIRNYANDVSNGYFPKLSGISCTASETALNYPSFSNTEQAQGTSAGCIFAGKALYFNTEDPRSIEAYTIAGRKAATSFPSLYPIVIDQSKESFNMPAGIQLINGTEAPITALVGLFFNLGTVTATTSSQGVAAVEPRLLSTAGTTLDAAKTSVKNAFISPGSTAQELTNSGIVLCFKSGVNSQKATITLNKSINGFNTTLAIGVGITTATGCINGSTI